MDAIGYDIAGVLGYKLDRKLSTGLDELLKKTEATSEHKLVFWVSTKVDHLTSSNTIGYDVTDTTGYTLTLLTNLDELLKEAKEPENSVMAQPNSLSEPQVPV